MMILDKGTFGDENKHKVLVVLNLEAEKNKKVRTTMSHINKILKDIEDDNLKSKAHVLKLLRDNLKVDINKRFEASIASRLDNYIKARIVNIKS